MKQRYSTHLPCELAADMFELSLGALLCLGTRLHMLTWSLILGLQASGLVLRRIHTRAILTFSSTVGSIGKNGTSIG